jgi:hypothetical protein
MHYNFCRIQTLRVTPAMAAGTSHVWDIAEILKLLEARAADKAA